MRQNIKMTGVSVSSTGLIHGGIKLGGGGGSQIVGMRRGSVQVSSQIWTIASVPSSGVGYWNPVQGVTTRPFTYPATRGSYDYVMCISTLLILASLLTKLMKCISGRYGLRVRCDARWGECVILYVQGLIHFVEMRKTTWSTHWAHSLTRVKLYVICQRHLVYFRNTVWLGLVKTLSYLFVT